MRSFNLTNLSRLLSALAICSSLFLCTKARAQQTPPPFGKLYLTTGMGFGSNLSVNGSSMTLPPISVSLDIAILKQLTIGPYLAVAQTAGNDDAILGGRATYHFIVPSKLFGVYVGGMLGYDKYDNNIADEVDYNNRYGTLATAKQRQAAYSAFVGGDLNLSQHVQFFTELGYGITYVNLGFSFKLK
jgi:hypothetical protein